MTVPVPPTCVYAGVEEAVFLERWENMVKVTMRLPVGTGDKLWCLGGTQDWGRYKQVPAVPPSLWGHLSEDRPVEPGFTLSRGLVSCWSALWAVPHAGTWPAPWVFSWAIAADSGKGATRKTVSQGGEGRPGDKSVVIPSEFWGIAGASGLRREWVPGATTWNALMVTSMPRAHSSERPRLCPRSSGGGALAAMGTHK